ncbi:MAG: hypothetical protein ACR2KW_11810 [Rubrobacter sp.]
MEVRTDQAAQPPFTKTNPLGEVRLVQAVRFHLRLPWPRHLPP